MATGAATAPPTWLLRVDSGEVAYESATARMAEMVGERQRGERPDTLWLLTHPPVYTVGRHTPAAHLPFGPGAHIPVVETTRGGQLTYHGPGQLVGYLVVDLGPRRGVVDYLRAVELGLVDALAELGVPAERRCTPAGATLLTGVWTADTGRKIVSIGLRQSRGVTSHGFALNVTNDLAPFAWAVPCGLPEADMTSLARELADRGRPVPAMATVRDAVVDALATVDHR